MTPEQALALAEQGAGDLLEAMGPAAARQALELWGDVDRRELTALLLSQLAEVQQEARHRGQLRAALAAIDAMARLARL